MVFNRGRSSTCFFCWTTFPRRTAASRRTTAVAIVVARGQILSGRATKSLVMDATLTQAVPEDHSMRIHKSARIRRYEFELHDLKHEFSQKNFSGALEEAFATLGENPHKRACPSKTYEDTTL
jgi:hypothetical protein